MSKFVNFNIENATASETNVAIIEIYRQLKALVRSANVAGTDAADFKSYPGTGKGKTTVSVAAAAAATTVIIVTSDTGGTKVGGRAITNNDFLLVRMDTPNDKGEAWQLLDITGNSADSPNSKNTLTVAGFDNITGLEKAVAADNVAYIVSVESVGTTDVDANALQLLLPTVGDAGHPLALSINEGSSGTTHRATGVVEYVN